MTKDITLKTLIKKALQFVNATDIGIYTFLRRVYFYQENNSLLTLPQKMGNGWFKVVQYKSNKKTFYITPRGQEALVQDVQKNFPPLGFGVSLGSVSNDR